jgi:triosephosphate isomerase
LDVVISYLFIDCLIACLLASCCAVHYFLVVIYYTLDEVHAYLRTILAKLYDEDVAQATRIQYGGSVTPDTVDALMAQPNIDGCLVGGASMDAEKFGRIINYQRSE